MFERTPFWKCPICHVEAAFGVLGVHSEAYTRRCVKCRHSVRIQLPTLQKKVLYLDQLVISEIAKSLMYRREDRWTALFRKLHRLVNAQLIVCPDSDIHFLESSASSLFGSLKRIYKHLSGGVAFYDTASVDRFQFCKAFDKYAKTKWASRGELVLPDIVHGNVNGWQDVLMIVPNSQLSEEDLDSLRKSRESIALGFAEVFERWRTEKKTFDEYYEAEARSAGPLILNVRQQYRERIVASVFTGEIMDMMLAPPEADNTYSSLRSRLEVDDYRVWSVKIVDEFLLSDAVLEIPTVRISAALYAAIARQANSGRKQPPSRGLANDLKIVSSYLPFVDAMFIDNEMRILLQTKDVSNRIQYRPRLFSASNFDEFDSLLDSIWRAATADHWKVVVEVYGDRCGSDYDSILDEYLSDRKENASSVRSDC